MEVVTTALTAALVIVTAMYVWLTREIAKRTGDSAEAAKIAAEASRAAAEAAQRSALVAEAALPLRFEVALDRHHDGVVWITLRARKATVWVHGAKITNGLIAPSQDGPMRQVSEPVELVIPQDYRDTGWPTLLPHDSDGLSLEWPNPLIRMEDYGCGLRVEVRYSLAKEGEVYTRHAWLEKPDDFYHRINQQHRYFPDHLPPADADTAEDANK